MHTVSSMVIRDLFNAARHLGVNERTLCDAAMFYRDSMFNADKRYPASVLANLWKHAKTQSKVENFGLKQGQIFDVGVLNTLGFLLMNSADLHAALKEYCNYQRIVGSAIVLSFDTTVKGVVLRIDVADAALQELNEVAESSFAASLICSLRFLSGHHVVPNKVQFSFKQPPTLAEYAQLFACTLEFNCPTCTLEFSDSVLAMPVIHHNPLVKQTLKDIINPILKSVDNAPQHAISASILRQFEQHGVVLKLEDMAAKLAISSRSLQAKLASEGSSYKALVRQYQESMARHLLDKPDMAIADIAYLLGYSEHTNFSRAFANWTGKSPKQYREASNVN
jgi:AraC-like DNA-binding protein